MSQTTRQTINMILAESNGVDTEERKASDLTKVILPTGPLQRSQPSRPRWNREGTQSRREIANSNERRRMQSINSGFQELRTLLPLANDDKLSKSSILQHAVSHIKSIEEDRLRLRIQNNYLRKQSGDSDGLTVREDRISGEDTTNDAELANACDSIRADELTKRADDYNTALLAALESKITELENSLAKETQRRLLAEDLLARLLPQSVKKGTNEKTVITDSEQIRQIVATMADDSDSMSRRNLDTIVEAIHHLEGEPLVKHLRLTNQGLISTSSALTLLSDQFSVTAAGNSESAASQIIVQTAEDMVAIPAVAAFEELPSDQIYTIVTTDSDVAVESTNSGTNNTTGYLPSICSQ